MVWFWGIIAICLALYGIIHVFWILAVIAICLIWYAFIHIGAHLIETKNYRTIFKITLIDKFKKKKIIDVKETSTQKADI